MIISGMQYRIEPRLDSPIRRLVEQHFTKYSYFIYTDYALGRWQWLSGVYSAFINKTE